MQNCNESHTVVCEICRGVRNGPTTFIHQRLFDKPSKYYMRKYKAYMVMNCNDWYGGECPLKYLGMSDQERDVQIKRKQERNEQFITHLYDHAIPCPLSMEEDMLTF